MVKAKKNNWSDRIVTGATIVGVIIFGKIFGFAGIGGAVTGWFVYNRLKNNNFFLGIIAGIISGIITGFVSAPMGIGGAVMNVPILKFFGYPINKAIGSAAAIGFIIALFGTIGFLFSGNYLNANLPLSIGFLNIPAFLIFFPITAFMARLGAKASHRINKKKMTKYFGLFLIVIGSKFLYEYFNL